MNESRIQKIVTQDIKWIVSIVGVTIAIVGTYYSLVNKVDMMNMKLDSVLSAIEKLETTDVGLTASDAILSQRLGEFDGRVSKIEGMLSIKPLFRNATTTD